MAGSDQINRAHRAYVDISERAMGLLAHVFATRLTSSRNLELSARLSLLAQLCDPASA